MAMQKRISAFSYGSYRYPLHVAQGARTLAAQSFEELRLHGTTRMNDWLSRATRNDYQHPTHPPLPESSRSPRCRRSLEHKFEGSDFWQQNQIFGSANGLKQSWHCCWAQWKSKDVSKGSLRTRQGAILVHIPPIARAK